MAGISHAFTNPKADGADTTVVRPSDWNAGHLIDGLRFGAGTSFPGSPATNDLFHRTDLGLQFYWDGTRWVSTTLYREQIGVGDSVNGFTVGSITPFRSTTWGADFDLWLVKLYTYTFVATTNDGTHFWSIQLNKNPGATAVGSAITTASDSVNTYTSHIQSLGVSLVGATYFEMQIDISKVSTPGNLFMNAAVSYRLIGV